jgi:hypothetical protein
MDVDALPGRGDERGGEDGLGAVDGGGSGHGGIVLVRGAKVSNWVGRIIPPSPGR